jgi:hypothetical protein
MTHYQSKLDQMQEMLEVVKAEFYDEDGTRYGDDPSEYTVKRWMGFLEMAAEAGGFKWSERVIWSMANAL